MHLYTHYSNSKTDFVLTTHRAAEATASSSRHGNGIMEEEEPDTQKVDSHSRNIIDISSFNELERYDDRSSMLLELILNCLSLYQNYEKLPSLVHPPNSLLQFDSFHSDRDRLSVSMTMSVKGVEVVLKR